LQGKAAFVGLGANLGDAVGALHFAVQSLQGTPGLAITAQSSLYRSAPVDSSGPDYVNAVIELQTGLEPFVLLLELQRIENLAGRERPYRNAPRTLDLDLLLYEGCTLHMPHLTVPHPRMWERAFVLLPLHEIAPQLVGDELLAAVSHQHCSRM
jgi:2-amino-4-hydroxy-6-hydroxymethyldihydropteridine diphosphokinase